MATKEQKLRELEKSTTNNHGSFSLGMFSTALLVYSISKGPGWIGFVVIGAIFVLSSLYFLCINKLIKNKKRQKIINIASHVRINHIEWFLGLVPFGIGLIQTVKLDWAAIMGSISIGAGYLILLYGIFTGVKEAANELIPNNSENI